MKTWEIVRQDLPFVAFLLYFAFKSCANAAENSPEYDGKQQDICSKWTKFTNCSKKCGGGVREKYRVAKTEDCVETFFQESCNVHPCDASDVCGLNWYNGPMSECSNECSGGYQTIEYFRADKTFCQRFPQSCNNDSCFGDTTHPSSEHVTEWTEFSECSKKCGGGYREKQRISFMEPNIQYSIFYAEPCNIQSCPLYELTEEQLQCLNLSQKMDDSVVKKDDSAGGGTVNSQIHAIHDEPPPEKSGEDRDPPESNLQTILAAGGIVMGVLILAGSGVSIYYFRKRTDFDELGDSSDENYGDSNPVDQQDWSKDKSTTDAK